MKLLTQQNRKDLPPMNAHDGDMEALVPVKFFTPWANWTWYAFEFDGEDEFFGLVVGLETELGYFSLSELQAIRGPFGFKVERDMHWRPISKADLFRKVGMDYMLEPKEATA